MQASELRIGNFVLDRSGKVLKIDRFYGCKIECDVKGMPDKDEDTGIPIYYHPFTEEIKYCQPIPVTEQRLLRLGFEYFIDTEMYAIGTFFIEKEHNNKFVVMYDCLSKSVEYVHDLQNLYFALTGEELTI